MLLLSGTLMAIFMESPILICIEVNSIGIFLIPVSIHIAKSSSVDFYNPLCNQINGQCQSLSTVQRRPPPPPPKLPPLWVKCAKQIHGSILDVCFAKLFHIFIIIIIIWGRNLQEQILLHHVRLSTEKWQECWMCHNDASAKFVTSHPVLKIDFLSQATPPCVADHTEKIWP